MSAEDWIILEGPGAKNFANYTQINANSVLSVNVILVWNLLAFVTVPLKKLLTARIFIPRANALQLRNKLLKELIN